MSPFFSKIFQMISLGTYSYAIFRSMNTQSLYSRQNLQIKPYNRLIASMINLSGIKPNCFFGVLGSCHILFDTCVNHQFDASLVVIGCSILFVLI